MIIGVETVGGKEFFSAMKKRLSQPTGFMFLCESFVQEVGGIWIVGMSPRIPEFWKLGLPTLIITLLFSQQLGAWSWVGIIPGALMTLTAVLWSRFFYKFLLRIAIKKEVGAKPVFLQGEALIMRLVGWHKMKF